MSLSKLLAGLATAVGSLLMLAGPAYAHDCFNPQKDAHAPTAGVNYTIVGFDGETPIFEQTGPGKGYGGFVALPPELTGGETTSYTHSLGNFSKDNGHDVVGGPGSQTEAHGCDHKGIDYYEICYPSGD